MSTKGKPAISVVWFKTTDLRTHDHEPLCIAHSAGFPVLHLFVLDPRWFRSTPLLKIPRTGPLRAQFQLQALEDLRGQLEDAGHSLCVRRGETSKVFEELCMEFEIKGVYAGHEVCTEELRVEKKVADVLARFRAGELNLCWMYELHHYDDLPDIVRKKGAAGFSGYRRCFADQCKPREPLPRPKLEKTSPGASWNKNEGLPSCVHEIPGLENAAAVDEQVVQLWKGGESAALAHLAHYFFESDSIAFDFTGATNFPHDGQSCTEKESMTKLSPWLAHGCLSARYLLAELKRYESERFKTDSTARLVHELYFRDFVRFSALLKGSKIFKQDGIYGRHPPGGWLQDKENVFEPWQRGTTGFPFLDASMRELLAAGHCSHAGREIAGWFLVCDLGLDWRLGAEWFESRLIDYEPASNWFNWAFTIVPRASGGNAIQEEAQPYQPPRTRLQTLEVVYWAAQSDPDATYIKKWVPELSALSSTLAREPWRAGDSDGIVAARDHRAGPEENPPPVAKERERIGWARRTFSAGGSAVAVWGFSSQTNASSSDRKVDPEDGKEYTLNEMRSKYKKHYSQKEIQKYWQKDCLPAAKSKDDKSATTTREEKDVEYKEWPQGYPKPLIPPASFYCIEDIADHARKCQKRRTENAARRRVAKSDSAVLGQKLAKDRQSNGYEVSKPRPQAHKRWGR